MSFSAGPNITRIKDKFDEARMYSVACVDEDLCQIKNKNQFIQNSLQEYSTLPGDLVLGTMIGKAAVVSEINSGRLLSSNFVKCKYDEKRLDPWFFCYWINESDEARYQDHQCIGRAFNSINSLEMLSITLPDIYTQRKIGSVYKKMKRIEYLMDESKKQMEKLSLQIIKNKMKGNN